MAQKQQQPPRDVAPPAPFRFLRAEVAAMETTAQQLTGAIFPPNDAIAALATRFNSSAERAGMVAVTPKQVRTWFQNRRYAARNRESRVKRTVELRKLLPPAPRKNWPLRPKLHSRALPSRQAAGTSSGNRCTGELVSPSARCSRPFLPEECVNIKCWDFVLCPQENKELSVLCDARVHGVQRTQHDSKECHCRFYVIFEHDNSEATFPLAKLRGHSWEDYQKLMAAALEKLENK